MEDKNIITKTLFRQEVHESGITYSDIDHAQYNYGKRLKKKGKTLREWLKQEAEKFQLEVGE